MSICFVQFSVFSLRKYCVVDIIVFVKEQVHYRLPCGRIKIKDSNMDDIGLTLVGGNTRSSSQAITLSGWNKPNSISLTTPSNQIVSADSSLALTRQLP